MKHTYVTHHILFYFCPLFDMHLHLKFQVIQTPSHWTDG